MFDLFRSRAKAVRILLGAMLGMVALSMLVYLIPGAGTPTGDRNDQIVAEIGKDVLTLRDVELAVQQQLKSNQIPADLVQVVIPQQVDQMIEERALAFEAKRLGFEVSDQALANTIRSTQFGTLNTQQYRDAIEQQMGMTVAEFESNIRLGLAGNALEALTIEGSIVPPSEVEAEYKRRNEKIKLDYVGFDPAKLMVEVKPSNEELKAYFDKNKNFFTVPETRDLHLIVADQAKIGAAIQIPDAQIQSYYNSHKDQYRTPERVQARHILIKTTGKSKEEGAQLKSKADDLLKQIKGGADFAKTAEKSSEDTVSAAKGGDLGWIVRGQMVKNFEDTVFALKPKDISDVITTEYGYHIIQVTGKEPAHLRPVDEARPEIVGTLKNQLVFDRMQTLTDQARAELVKAPQDAQQIAAKLNLQFVNQSKYKQGDAVPPLVPDAQLNATINSLKKGEVSQVLQSGDKLAIVEVTAIYPSHPAEFAEVDAQVRAQYGQQKGVQAAADKSKKLADLLKTNGGDLNAGAKSLGLEVKTADFFARNGAAEGIGSATYLGDAFDKPVGSIIGPINAGSQTVVGKITDRQEADMSKLAQDRDSIVLGLKGKKTSERQVLLRDSILSNLIQQGKVKKHTDVINRLIARYRS